MAEQRPPWVLISYQHEPDWPQRADRVLAFANRLRANGIDVIIDQYVTAPPEGWPTWCAREIQGADFVLMVCTETYYRTLRYDDLAASDRGMLWETRIIRELLYDESFEASKFIPVLFADGTTKHIPSPLRRAARHCIDTAEGYESLYR